MTDSASQTENPGFHNRQSSIAEKICSLLISLTEEPEEYDDIAPNVEYWIEYVLRERFTTVDELVEGVSCVAWEEGGSYEIVARFLKEFFNSPHRSEQARSFVGKLCEHVLRWFTIASMEDLAWNCSGPVAKYGGEGLKRAASFVGHLIEHGMLGHNLVRRHLAKPLVSHPEACEGDESDIIRANAIFELFLIAGNTLLRGLLEPEDVQACFEILEAQISVGEMDLDSGELQNLRKIHTTWLEQKGKANDATETEERERGGEGAMAAEVPVEIGMGPITFVPQDLPTAATGIDIPPSILQAILNDAESPSETFVSIPATAPSSPTLSISTISDVAPTEFVEEIGRSGEQATTHHDTFYFEDGNTEVVCGDTIFRVHSSTVSFSSPKLRDVLSPSTLLGAPSPGGCPRIFFTDSAEDVAVLLKMIYTPGFPAKHEVPEFNVFASLLRMATKYRFSDVRDQLIKDLKGAYPTEWEAYRAADVLGEDVFGSPRPNPNAVLNLFVAQNVRFALPFAAYRASLGGFSALLSDKSGEVLPRHTLASTIYGMERARSIMTQAAYTIAYKKILLSICPDGACVLSVGVKPIERRMEALTKIHLVMIGERKDGVLSAPPLGDLACAKCTKEMEVSHAAWRRACWELLPATFSIAKCWDEV